MKTNKKGLSLADLKKLGAESINFDSLADKGESFVGGGSVLALEPGESVRGKVTAIELRQLDKRYDAVHCHAAKIGSQNVKLPAATSFRDKAAQAGLNIGDEFAVRRDADYQARGKDCQSYSLVVIKRGPNGRWEGPQANGDNKPSTKKPRR